MNYLQQKKRALISVHRSFIPSGYKQVEYLESTGEQYINEGTPLGSAYKTYTKFLFKTTPKNRAYLFGFRDADGQNAYTAYLSDYKTVQFQFISNAWLNIITGTFIRNSVVELETGNGYIIINGRRINKNNTGNFTTNGNSILFSMATTEEIYTVIAFYGNVYSRKIWRGDTLIRDFIPCLDNNNRPCMYDTVSKKTYYNQGTGEFLYGEVIN